MNNQGGTERDDAAIARQQQQRGNVSYFLFLSMMFFFMSNSGPDISTEQHFRDALSNLSQERDQFAEWLYPGSISHGHDNSSEASTSFLDQPITTSTVIPIAEPSDGGASSNNTTGRNNGTNGDGRTGPSPFILPDLTPPPALQQRVSSLLEQQYTSATYYRNISGWFKGSWLAHPSLDITDGKYNLSKAGEYQGDFPWAAKSRKEHGGKVVKLNVREAVPHAKGGNWEEENEDAEIVMLRGSMTLALYEMQPSKDQSDDGEDKTLELGMEGVHYKKNGTFFIHAAPQHIDLDMRHLPGLMFSNHTRNQTAQIILKELDARLERIRRALATGVYPDTTSDITDDSSLNCSFSIYGHLRPLPPTISRKRIKEYEDELHSPRGVSTVKLPPPTLDAILFSPECNLVLELDNMEGLEVDKFWNKAFNYSLILAAITALQAWVLVKQMEYTSTPTAIGKVSHATIAIQVVMDVYFCVTHLTLGVLSTNRASLAFLMPGFFGILSGLLFGLRYAAIIRVSTYRPPEPIITEAPVVQAQQPQAANRDSVALPRRSAELPNTTTPLLSRVPLASDSNTLDRQQIRNGIIFGFVAIAVVLTFAYIGWFPIMMTLIYSFWIPQVYQNAERGSGRHPLLKKYYMLTAATRMFIPLYIWACPANLLFTDTSPWVYALAGYQIVQVLFLFLQDKLGPRFFLPRGVFFAELDTWDYHPILPPTDIETGAGPDGNGKETDCVICFEKIELATPGRTSIDARTSEKEQTPGPGVFDGVRRGANRMSYMVPPCHHIAHTSCLESWAAIKMECPLCRRPLPPF